MADSGAFVSCIPKDYASEVAIESSPKLKLKSVLGEQIQHYGVRRNLEFEDCKGDAYRHDFQVTDCMRPILSVRECNNRAELVCFGPHEKRIITDVTAIAKIEQILKQAGGRQIIEERVLRPGGASEGGLRVHAGHAGSTRVDDSERLESGCGED